MLKYLGRALIAASLSVAAGVAVNQILNNGKLSWSWGYLALVFTVLGGLVQAAPQAAQPPSEDGPPPAPRRRAGSRREYLRRMRSTVDQMETIGLVTQAEFVLRTRQVYVDVMLRPRTVTDVVTDTGIGPGPAEGAGRRASLASFLAGGRMLAVLGAAGSGKTTLARHTALEMVERRRFGLRRRGRLPVLLYLRDHAASVLGDEPGGLAQIAAAAPWLNGAVSAEWLEHRLERGQCVVLLDGLDEVADARHRGRVVQWMEEQYSRYPDNAFVVTSRPGGYDGNRLSRADVLQVQRFTSRQIRDFLHAWYRAIEHRSREGDARGIDLVAARSADDLFHRISGRPTLYDMAANPLLLTMIANVHRYRGSLPGSRAALYEEVCQVLLHRRQEAKNLGAGEVEELSGDKKERIVQELAWYMMRRKLRDIPAEEAERAIRTVLQRTAPDITPEAFLRYVRRSGLLLEHQYRHYGFAHLTLQEYLAAALVPGHASRRQLLVENVSDPAWRETTLLWAARADASPVVEACLEARTVTALSLAYACLDEAREVDPALRARLDELLNTTSDDPDEIRLLDGVAAARALQDTHALDDTGTRICADPVPNELWARYASHVGNDSNVPEPGADLWSTDIPPFLFWLNGLFGDGTGYRLPTPSEASHALGSDLYPADRTGLYAADGDWTSGQGRTRVVTAAPDLHPHRPARWQIAAYPELILDHTHFVIRVLAPFAQMTFWQLAAYAGDRRLMGTEQRLLHAIDLALDLAFSSEPAHGLTRDRASEKARALGLDIDLDDRPAPPSIVDMMFRNAIGRALDHARDLHRDHDAHFAADRDFTPGRIEALLPALEILLMYDAGHRGLPSSAPGSSAVPVIPTALAQTAHHVPVDELNRALDRALDRALGLAHEAGAWFPRSGTVVPTRDIPRALERARRDDAPVPGPVPILVLARDLALAQARAVDYDSDGSRPHADYVARDLAFAQLGASSGLGTQGVVAMGLACAQLTHCFTAHAFEDGTGRRRRREEEASLTRYLGKLLTAQTLPSVPPSDDPAVTLGRAQLLAQRRGERALETLIANASVLSAPLWDPNRPARQEDLVWAATSVLAALTLVGEEEPDEELAEVLRSVLATLIALTPQASGYGEPEPRVRKQLVLVRG
ncbi:NACHT domain-containing protein [Actinomadura geliboluensis]|uniref:NACHT domain-containing protein n=1 Tax=Actinomadura geliboluensis TaxID=882440 RepID=A0A5S4H6A1_9ACTN|nr:NACHT domain-containing protein [Actinomadura geliboluensis]TMR40753.1 NACHT domain-containing protein [Actinomadura geliboluensis]